jgi:hypothetical protein
MRLAFFNMATPSRLGRASPVQQTKSDTHRG